VLIMYGQGDARMVTCCLACVLLASSIRGWGLAPSCIEQPVRLAAHKCVRRSAGSASTRLPQCRCCSSAEATLTMLAAGARVLAWAGARTVARMLGRTRAVW
jgi:hypothetical protein